MTDKITLTTPEVCERYGITRRTVNRWQNDHGFPQPFTFGRYFVADVERWDQERSHYQDSVRSATIDDK